MNRIYIYVMLFSGILFLNSMTCFAANEKLSASSRQTLDQFALTIDWKNYPDRIKICDFSFNAMNIRPKTIYWNVAFYRMCHWETDSIQYVFHRRNCLVF